MSPVVKRLSWALALSIGLNLFLVGFGVARAVRKHDEHAHGRAGLMRTLGPPSPELRTQRERLNEARKHVGEALEAEPFDRARAQKALSTLRTNVTRGQELLHERLVDKAASLSPRERHELAQQRFSRANHDD